MQEVTAIFQTIYKQITTTVVSRPFSLLTQGLASSFTQQLPPPFPLLHIFPFQPALSHVPLHHQAPCHHCFSHPLLPSTSNDMIFFTQSSSCTWHSALYPSLIHHTSISPSLSPYVSISHSVLPSWSTFHFHLP